MRLSERLSFARTSAGTAKTGPAAAEAPTNRGFEHRGFEVEPGMGGAAAVAPGLGTLRIPNAAQTRRGMAVLDEPAAADAPVLVLDVETSGLGSDAVPFIVGLAWHSRDVVMLEQWTLLGSVHERAMLAHLQRRLQEAVDAHARLVTYNGASFDLPVLRGRLDRLRLCGSWLQRPHLDLLHPARRLWRGRFVDCRLTTLETKILGVRRVGDMEGAAIAELFARLCKHPDDPWLREDLACAQAHNRADLLGLLALTAAAGQRMREPTMLSEAVAAARHLEARGRLAEAIDRLRSATQAEQSDSTGLREAMLLWAELERRAGDRTAAVELWTAICQRWPGTVQAHERLAKDLEHRQRRFVDALAVAAGSACPCPRRLDRLRRKAERTDPATGGNGGSGL